MADIASMLGAFSEVAAHPSKELDKHLAAGKRVIGVGPYHVPEELVYAAGAVPFGVWGMVGSADEAKKYYPPFYCSICQMTLEMGLKGILDKLSGMMITGLCDTLRASSQNWKAAMGNKVPLIYVTNAQNRFLPAGHKYTVDAYTEVKRRVEECCDTIIDDDQVMAAIKLYNQWRAAMREFVQLAGSHPAEVSNAARVAVVNAGYYMDKAEHLQMVRELNEALAALPESTEGYRKVVLSGIYQDIPAITSILDDNKIAVVADDLAKESRAFARQVPEEGAHRRPGAEGEGLRRRRRGHPSGEVLRPRGVRGPVGHPRGARRRPEVHHGRGRPVHRELRAGPHPSGDPRRASVVPPACRPTEPVDAARRSGGTADAQSPLGGPKSSPRGFSRHLHSPERRSLTYARDG